MGTINANLSGIIMEPKQKLAEQKKENNKIIYMRIKKAFNFKEDCKML